MISAKKKEGRKMKAIDTGDCIGIVRNLDRLRRITIPAEYCKTMGIKEGQPLEILLTGSGILIRPAKDTGEFL